MECGRQPSLSATARGRRRRAGTALARRREVVTRSSIVVSGSDQRCPTMSHFRWSSCLVRKLITRKVWAVCVSFALMRSASAQPTPTQTVTNAMTLRETLQRVLDFNESVQMRVLDHEISRKTYEAEKGIYEPAVVGSVDHVDNRRENNAQALLSLQNNPRFAERNTIYNGGLEFLAPSGAKLRTGVTLRDLQNNLQQQRSILGGGANVVDRE